MGSKVVGMRSTESVALVATGNVVAAISGVVSNRMVLATSVLELSSVVGLKISVVAAIVVAAIVSSTIMIVVADSAVATGVVSGLVAMEVATVGDSVFGSVTAKSKVEEKIVRI